MAKNVIIGQSGGPTAVINSSLAGVYKAACSLGADKVYGMKYGIEGLLKEELVDLNVLLDDRLSIELLKRTPSSYLGSCRYKLPEPEADSTPYVKLFTLFDKYDICAVFYIGGNDSMDTIAKLSRYGAQVGSAVRFIGVPKTIDNDLCLTDHTPGYGSAAKYIATILKEVIRDSSVYDIRSVTVAEIMGRHAGYLALYVGVAVGATAVLVPEHQYDFEKHVAEKIRAARLGGKTNFMIVVAEGAASAMDVGKEIKEHLGLDPRVTILGHIQRGGSPTAKDRVLATRMGYEAVRVLAEGMTNRVICVRDDQIVNVDIDEGLAMKKTLNAEEFEVMTVMTGV